MYAYNWITKVSIYNYSIGCHSPIRFNALSIFILIESSSIYSGMLDAIYQNRCDLKCSVPNATQQRHYRTIMVALLIHVLCYMAWHDMALHRIAFCTRLFHTDCSMQSIILFNSFIECSIRTHLLMTDIKERMFSLHIFPDMDSVKDSKELSP